MPVCRLGHLLSPWLILVSRQHFLQEPPLPSSKVLRIRKTFKGSPASSLSLLTEEELSLKALVSLAHYLGRCRMAPAPAQALFGINYQSWVGTSSSCFLILGSLSDSVGELSCLSPAEDFCLLLLIMEPALGSGAWPPGPS